MIDFKYLTKCYKVIEFVNQKFKKKSDKVNDLMWGICAPHDTEQSIGYIF